MIEKYREYRAALEAIAESEEILSDKDADRDLLTLAEEELDEAKKNLKTVTGELKILLLPKDENDDRNVIIEIRAGTGGDEAALFALRPLQDVQYVCGNRRV